MRCAWCGHTFDWAAAQQACRACPLAWGCRLVRCPRCGYEMVPDPALLRGWRRIRNWVREARRGQGPRAESGDKGGAAK